MPLKNRRRLSKTGCGGISAARKEFAPFINRLAPPKKHINVTSPNKICKLNTILSAKCFAINKSTNFLIQVKADTLRKRNESTFYKPIDSFFCTILLAHPAQECGPPYFFQGRLYLFFYLSLTEYRVHIL